MALGFNDMGTGLFDRAARSINEDRIGLAVTGLSRSGKTVFVTSLIQNLLALGHGVNTLYAHLSRRIAQPGQVVARGERIAEMGATGRVTGPHLHFSLSWFLQWLDPQPVVLPA